ncbi:hypothetical protein [Anaeromusa sp.]|nr:hypothetical protein [Anaeromusa sp.]MDD3157665.1 hypothetical protein [Anaeromusa sp.]
MKAITSDMLDILTRQDAGELSELEALALLCLEIISENHKGEEVAV